MLKSLLSVLVFLMLFAGIWNSSDSGRKNNETLKRWQSAYQNEETENTYKADTSEIPEEIKFPSTVGRVLFPHQMHIDDLEIECVECHHQINAKILVTPHSDYVKSSWIKCEICHKESGQIEQKIFTCSECHHPSPVSIADETLSSKVVIHESCWECHEVGTGSEASEICGECHSSEKRGS
ncbi:MAG TPA: hypothetical protein VI362_03640 [Ignavibacteriaceae bacterium]|nr:hypothetical protein [Ignavibacteriaceae bacterium]